MHRMVALCVPLILTACMPVSPERKQSPHPRFEYPVYDLSVCEQVGTAQIPEDDLRLLAISQKLISLAVLYDSTPSYVMRMLYVAERYGVSEDVFLYGFENFTDVLDAKQQREDPIIATYYSDSFLAFNQWHSALADMTDQGQVSERNSQIKEITGITPQMSLNWYKYLLSDWQADFDSIGDNVPTDDLIVKMATVNKCKNIQKTKNQDKTVK